MDENFRVVDVSKLRIPNIPWRNAVTGVVAIIALVAAAGTAFQVEPEEVGGGMVDRVFPERQTRNTVHSGCGRIPVFRTEVIMTRNPYRVAIVGCGRMGQIYAQAYSTYPDTEIVAIADVNVQRLRAVGERFNVKALFKDVDHLLKDTAPDIVAIIAPTKYMKDAVIAAAEGGVKGVSAEKPIAGVLADADAMVEACEQHNVVFAGGNLQRAMNEVQEAARRIQIGEFGALIGASIHGFGGEISGGGCQHISVLRLFVDAEVEEVVAWGTPEEALHAETDEGLIVHGHLQMTSGLTCQVFGTPTPYRGVDVWSHDALVRWDWAPPEIFQGFDETGARVRIDPHFKGITQFVQVKEVLR